MDRNQFRDWFESELQNMSIDIEQDVESSDYGYQRDLVRITLRYNGRTISTSKMELNIGLK
jgi:hypothetical protein